LLLEAQLLKKVNEDVQALSAVNKAICSIKRNGEGTKVAEELLLELVKSDHKQNLESDRIDLIIKLLWNYTLMNRKIS